jgi:hypothetical protein
MTNVKFGQATFLAVAMAAAFGWVGIGNVRAAVEPCGAEIDAVRTSIEQARFDGKNSVSDQSNLLAKVDVAASKVVEGKLTDAAAKLQDVADTAVALASAPKPKLDDAGGITAAVDAAITCLSGL